VVVGKKVKYRFPENKFHCVIGRRYITRGISHEIEDNDGVKVKEVSVADLIELIKKRLLEYIYDQQSLSGELSIIGN
jgi:hypothetical protein